MTQPKTYQVCDKLLALAANYKSQFPYSGKFKNLEDLNLAYRIRFPYHKLGDSKKFPLFLYIDGSGPFPLDMITDNILSHYQSKGFVAAMKQKRGVKPSEGNFSKLTFEERIQDNLDFINYLINQYPEIDSEQVYIMGHSEGATIAGVIAFRYQKTAGLIWASACFDEDWFDIILSSHPQSDTVLIKKLRDGTYKRAKWQYYSKVWWFQHFNHLHFPELMKVSCPVIFLCGDKDNEFSPLKKRFEEMITKRKKNISLFILPLEGHRTISIINQEALFSTIDKWFENIFK